MEGDMNKSKSEGERQAMRIDPELESKAVDGNCGSARRLCVRNTATVIGYAATSPLLKLSLFTVPEKYSMR